MCYARTYKWPNRKDGIRQVLFIYLPINFIRKQVISQIKWGSIINLKLNPSTLTILIE